MSYLERIEAKPAMIDPTEIRNRLKTKISGLVWTKRPQDGIAVARVDFADGNYAEYTIGEMGDALRLTYYKGQKKDDFEEEM